VQQRAALGLVTAEDFSGTSKAKIEDLGLQALSLEDLLRIVRLWDPVKQRAALNAFQWVVTHIEQSTGLMDRVDEFLYSTGYKIKPSAPRRG
jgi:hypothetical protein